MVQGLGHVIAVDASSTLSVAMRNDYIEKNREESAMRADLSVVFSAVPEGAELMLNPQHTLAIPASDSQLNVRIYVSCLGVCANTLQFPSSCASLPARYSCTSW